VSKRAERVRLMGLASTEMTVDPHPASRAYTLSARFVLAALIALEWLGGCSDNPEGPDCAGTCPPPSMVISDPSPAAGIVSGALGAAARSNEAGDSIVYVSLAPGTAPTGFRVTVRSAASGTTVTTGVRDGGFDPVPVFAKAGDAVEVIVRDGSQAIVFQTVAVVAAARPPIVVRTEPPPRKRDVPLNASMVIAFSEPVASGTLGPSSIQLFRGDTPVEGSVSLLPGTGAAAAFTPVAPLTANTDYRLVVAQAVRDLDGDALEAGVTVEFTTGQSSTGSAVSITLSPDTVRITTGVTYQMTATVRDAAGNILTDQPVTWATNDSSGLTVSPTGLLTTLADGFYSVIATSNGLTAWAGVMVTPRPSVSVAVSPTSASVAAGDTIILSATVRDATGRVIRFPSVTWTSSAPAVATVAPNGAGNLGAGVATVTGVSPGSATITATSGTASGTAAVTVIPPQPVASVTVTPASAAVVVQGKVQLAATLRDANGRTLSGRLVTWTSDNPAVATVDANGVVTGVSLGSAAVTATSEGVSGTASVTVELLVPVLAFVSLRDLDYEIYALHSDGSLQRNLTNQSGQDVAPEWSPDGQKIVFVSARDGKSQIYVMNADGSAPTRLTNNSAWDGRPRWSPDGQKIVFVSGRDGNADIYVMNADGSAQTRLTNNANSWESPPAWSPDGRKIAFESNYDIYVVNADGSGQTNLTNYAGYDWDHAWSPDGQRILFTSNRDGNVDIYAMDANGANLTRITTDGGIDSEGAWSPDGTKIAFTCRGEIANLDICVMDASGANQTRIPAETRLYYDHAWSPDGSKIAFVSFRDDSDGELYLMNADGSDQTRLTNAPGSDFWPRWRP